MRLFTASQEQIITGKIIKRTPKGKLVVDVGSGHVLASANSYLDVGDGVTLIKVGSKYQILTSFVATSGRDIREYFIKV
jgi:hypothetical protein